MTTSLERENRRVFQKYLTTVLFNETVSLDIETVCNKLAAYCWKYVSTSIYSIFYPNRDMEFPDFFNRYIWEFYCRFFLKGNKATLKGVKRSIEALNKDLENVNNFLNLMERKFVDLENESDFDFAFAINPNYKKAYDNFEECHLRLVRLTKELKEMFDSEISTIISKTNVDLTKKLITDCNDIEIQKQYLLPALKLIASQVEEFPEKAEIKGLLDIIESNKPLTFSFEKTEAIIPSFSKPIDTGEDQFLLYRVCLLCSCKEAPTLFSHKQIAELFDISFSLNASYNESLWEKTTLDDLLQPVKYLTDKDFQPTQIYEGIWFDYPMVNLNFQLKDAVLIFSEEDPSKPESRCKRFIDQIRFFCLQEKQPQLPEQIVVRKKMFDLMQNAESSCYNLKDIFDVFDSHDPDNVILKTKHAFLDNLTFYKEKDGKLPNLPNFSAFEKWCGQQQIQFESILFSPNKKLNFYSACENPFRSKFDLMLNLIDLQNNFNFQPFDVENIKRFTKNQLCMITKDAIVLACCLKIYRDFMDPKYTVSNEKDFVDSFEKQSVFRGQLRTISRHYIKKEPINTVFLVDERVKLLISVYLNKTPYEIAKEQLGSLKEYVIKRSMNQNFNNVVENIYFEFI
jgi:hypothetical protein